MLSPIFMKYLGRATLIKSGEDWALLFVLLACVAWSIHLEQKYSWAAKISGSIVGMGIAMILSNLAILPAHSALYDDIIWNYAVPLAIPLLLLNCDIRKIWRETGRMLAVFLIGALGTVLGSLLAFRLLGGIIPDAAKVAAMMTGSYIGGSLNFAAIAAEFKTPSSTAGAATVADNLLMAIYFFVLIFFAGRKFFRSHYPHPHIEAAEREKAETGESEAASYWRARPISLFDLAKDLGYAAAVTVLAKLIALGFSSLIPEGGPLLTMAGTFLGSQYVWITTLSMITATLRGADAAPVPGAQEIGTYFIYLFLFVIGVPASIPDIVLNTPALFLFTGIMVAVNMVFCFAGGKLLRCSLEDCILASNANIGGPTTAAGMAISQGWAELVGPVILIGTFGYVIGTYLGIAVGVFLGA